MDNLMPRGEDIKDGYVDVSFFYGDPSHFLSRLSLNCRGEKTFEAGAFSAITNIPKELEYLFSEEVIRKSKESNPRWPDKTTTIEFKTSPVPTKFGKVDFYPYGRNGADEGVFISVMPAYLHDKNDPFHKLITQSGIMAIWLEYTFVSFPSDANEIFPCQSKACTYSVKGTILRPAPFPTFVSIEEWGPKDFKTKALHFDEWLAGGLKTDRF